MSVLTEKILSDFVDSSQKKDFYENRGKNATELNSCADLKLNAAGKYSNSSLQTKTGNHFHSLEDKQESASGKNETQISDLKPSGAFCVDELVGVDSSLQTLRPENSTEQDCCGIGDKEQTLHAGLSASAAIRYLNEMYSWADSSQPTAETFHSLEDSSQENEESVSGTNENPVSAFKPNVIFKCDDEIGKTEGNLQTLSPEDLSEQNDYYGTSETNSPKPKPTADLNLNAVINYLNGVYSMCNSIQQPNQKESQEERLAKHVKLLEEEILRLRDRCNTQQKQIQDHKDEKQKIKREKLSLEKQKRQLETAKWKVEQERRQVQKEKETLCNEKNTLEDIKLQLREETELLEEGKRLFKIKTKEFEKRKADETLQVALARLREMKNQSGTTKYLGKPKIQSETMDRLDEHMDFFEDLKQTLERKQSQSEVAEDSDKFKHPDKLDEPFKDTKLQLDELKPDPDVKTHLDDQNSHSSVMKRLDEHMDFFQDLQLQLDKKQSQSEVKNDSDTFKHPDELDELFKDVKLQLDELKPGPDVKTQLDEQNMYSSEVRRLDEHMDFFEDLKQTLERKQKQSETTKRLDEPQTRSETSRHLDEHFFEDHKQKLENKREQSEEIKDSDKFELLDDWLEEMEHLNDQKPDSNIATHLDDQNSHSSVMKRLDEHMDFFQDLQLQLDKKQRQSEEINDSDKFKHPDELDELFEDVKLQLDQLKPDPDVKTHLDEQNVYSSVMKRLDEHMDFFQDLQLQLDKEKNSRRQQETQTNSNM